MSHTNISAFILLIYRNWEAALLQEVTAYQEEVCDPKGWSVRGVVKGWVHRVACTQLKSRADCREQEEEQVMCWRMKTANMSHYNNYSKHTQTYTDLSMGRFLVEMGKAICQTLVWSPVSDYLHSNETSFEWNKYRGGLLGWSCEETAYCKGSKQCPFLCWQLCLTRVLWSSPKEQGTCCGSWGRQCTLHRKWLRCYHI